MSTTGGVVYLVGAGPGDPGLITVRGLNLLRSADVILHDRLIGHALLSEARRDAEIMYVGKARAAHSIGQDQTNALLIRFARAGKTVVRLKGGDPFVFGRGFEELCACRAAGVACQVIPGVSSALAAPVAAGIPITRRTSVRSVAVVTGSFAGECQAPPLDFSALAKMDTLMVLMGLAPLNEIASSLIEAGRDPSTPAASVENATTPAQRVVCATLGTIAREVTRVGLQAPVVTVIGKVASEAGVETVAASYAVEPPTGAPAAAECDTSARSTSSGGDPSVVPRGGCSASRHAVADRIRHSGTEGSLAGWHIAVTRPSARSRSLRRALARAGAHVLDCPMISVEFLESDNAALPHYDWIVFTSTYGVEGFVRRLRARRTDARALAGSKIAAIGSATARALRRFGITADLVPEAPGAKALTHTLIARATADPIGRVLYPCGDRALPTLRRGLEEAGISLDVVVVYRTVDATPSEERLARVRHGVDVVLFYSPSAVARFAALRLVRRGALAACVGPTTAGAAANAGLEDVVRLDELPGRTVTEKLASLRCVDRPVV